MRLLERNKQTVYYALYAGETDVVDANGLKTGEKTVAYGTPVAIRVSVSAAKGYAAVAQFGTELDYSRMLITEDMSCPITENSVLYVNTTPTGKPDYFVRGIAKSRNYIAYAIKEMKVR